MSGPLGHHAAATVAVGVESRLITHDHAIAPALVLVRIPSFIRGGIMTLVAHESRVRVAVIYVVGDDVVVVAPRRCEPCGQIGERDVGIAAQAASRDEPVVPGVAARDGAEVERIRRGEREDVAHPRRVVYVEGRLPSRTREHAVAHVAEVCIAPGLIRKEHLDAPLGVYPDHRDVGGLDHPEMHPGRVATGVGIRAIGPDLDAAHLIRRRRGRAGFLITEGDGCSKRQHDQQPGRRQKHPESSGAKSAGEGAWVVPRGGGRTGGRRTPESP